MTPDGSQRHAPEACQPETDTPRAVTDLAASTGLVGESASMRTLRLLVERHATHRFPVLVTGPTGTGKDLVARALHALGPRRARPFVAVNAATLRTGLAESELFGHLRGAFTGAVGPRRGHFDLASGGTLFLDEVVELDSRAQAALLRVLETGLVRPLGAETEHRVDVRLVAATHADLGAAVRSGHFREDLYHRLAVIHLKVPALTERRRDLPLLAEHLLERLRPDLGRRWLAEGALVPLVSHPWPGNVREFLHVLTRAALASDGLITAEHLLDALDAREERRPPRPPPTKAELTAAYAATHGNVSSTARLLGVARSTVRRHVRLHTLNLP